MDLRNFGAVTLLFLAANELNFSTNSILSRKSGSVDFVEVLLLQPGTITRWTPVRYYKTTIPG